MTTAEEFEREATGIVDRYAAQCKTALETLDSEINALVVAMDASTLSDGMKTAIASNMIKSLEKATEELTR